MFRSRRQLAAAAGFWVLLLAAATCISIIPGATAAADSAVFSDDFESGNLSQWSAASGMTVQGQVKYAGSWAGRATTSGTPAYAYKTLSTPLPELYYDGRFEVISQASSTASLVRFRTAAAGPILTIFRRANNKLAYVNELTGQTSIGPAVSAGAWHELEVHVLVNGGASLVEVWLDGTRVNSMSKTDSLGTAPVGRVYIGDPASGRTFDTAFDNQVVSIVDSSPPSTPTGLTVTAATKTTIALAWTPSTDNVGVVGYDVFQNDARLGTTPVTAYTYSGLTCGRAYTLGVDAFDAAANTSSRASVTASTAPCDGPTDITPPSTPTGLTVNGTTQSSISSRWNASTDDYGVAGYDLFRNNSRVGSTTATNYTFSGLACGTTYTLGVDAFDAAGNVSGRASITASTSQCGGATQVSELVFPSTPQSSGTPLPQHACADPNPSDGCAADNGFNRSDYAGWGNGSGSNDRISWVADPSGSGKTVAQFNVYGTDVSDQFQQVKTNLWRTPADNCDGCEGWYAVGFYIPNGFIYPDTWFLLMQNHGGAGNPAQSIELRTPPSGGSVRNYIYWKNQTAPTSGWSYFPLAPVREGHWVYIVAHIYLTTTTNGYVQVWSSTDALPDISSPPAVNQQRINTLYPGYGTGTASLPLYRDAGPSSQHQIVYYCGYHRAGTAATAMTLPSCPAG
jgi:Polysaccharide lyase